MTKKESKSFILVAVVAIGVSVLLIMFVFRSYQVDGPSMENTLQNNDKLIIWKVPRTWSSITGNAYIPNRGDIIVFNQSGLSTYGQDDTKQLIKRIIGLPGDRVTILNNHYEVYNASHPNGFNPDQVLPYDKNNSIPQTTGSVDVKLKSNQLFVSGDNRTDSLDSRAFGPIDASQVVGKLVLRFSPVSQTKVF